MRKPALAALLACNLLLGMALLALAATACAAVETLVSGRNPPDAPVTRFFTEWFESIGWIAIEPSLQSSFEATPPQATIGKAPKVSPSTSL